MTSDIRTAVSKIQVQETHKRVNNARQKFQNDWKCKPSNVYSKVDPQIWTPTVILEKPDGSLTGNFHEVEVLLRDAWLPIFDKYSTQSEPSWTNFETRYQAYFPAPVSMTLRPFSVLGIRKVLQHMKIRSASGPDGWTVADLRNLPDSILALLVNLFTEIERSQQWPAVLEYGFCSLIPKIIGDMSPANQRPLGIMSVIYRVYCGYRLVDVLQWQDSVIHAAQAGFRPGRGSDDVYYDIALSIEEALLSGHSLIGVHFDYKKAFDLVPRNIIFNLASRLGFSSSLLNVMKRMYSNLQRFFKIPGGHSQPFRSSCGILQGCPLSIVFMNLIVSIWCRTIEAETAAIPKAFADDSMVLATSVDTAKKAMDITGEFAKITKQELAAKKTVAWATLARDRQSLRKVQFQGHLLQVLLDTKSLGANLCSSHARMASHTSVKIQHAITMASKIASFPLPSKDRGLICATKILPKILYGSEISPPIKADFGKLRSAIARAVWKKRSCRSTDVVLSLLHPIHRIDPYCAWVSRCLSQLRRMCKRRPDLRQRIYQIWQSPITKSWFGPVSALKTAIRWAGLRWDTFETLSSESYTIDLFVHSRSFFQHQVRQSLRHRNLEFASKRADMQGIVSSEVDRVSLDRIINKLPSYHRGTYSAILSGGFRSAKHFLKAGLTDDSMCPFCGQCEEDVAHIFAHCPAWAVIRSKYPSVDWTWLLQAPKCTFLCAIPLVPSPVIQFYRSLPTSDELETSHPLSAADLLLETIKDQHVVVWTDGACQLQDNMYLRRAGYSVVYDTSLQHSRTVSKPLLGVEQTAQRAELRAVLAALKTENRPLHIRSDSTYAVNGLNTLLSGSTLPYDGDNIDLWSQVQDLLSLRIHPVCISWVKGHATSFDIEKGTSSLQDQAGNNAADAAAVSGAACHACPEELHDSFSAHSRHMTQIALMYVEIALARNSLAKKTQAANLCDKDKKCFSIHFHQWFH